MHKHIRRWHYFQATIVEIWLFSRELTRDWTRPPQFKKVPTHVSTVGPSNGPTTQSSPATTVRFPALTSLKASPS
jgi:hypothetical protein